MEEQSQPRHAKEEGITQQTPQPVYRPPRERIKASLKARGLGYPLIAILLLLSWLAGQFIKPRNFFFIERDPGLSYPYVDDTVPSWSLAFIGAFGPLFFIVLTQTLIRWSPRGVYFDKRTKDIHLVIIVLGEVLAVTWLITNLLKCYVGRLRPNFFAYCNYKGYRPQLNVGQIDDYLANTVPGAIGDFRFCLQDTSDAHFSFPSGHSSIAFCGLTFMTLFLLHVTARINFKHHAIGKIVRFFIVLIPLFAGALVGASRVIDYKHNVEDTVWGSLIGILGAFLAFHANYGYKRPTKPGIPMKWGHIQPQVYPEGMLPAANTSNVPYYPNYPYQTPNTPQTNPNFPTTNLPYNTNAPPALNNSNEIRQSPALRNNGVSSS